MKYIVILCRILVGVLFIISGFIKANDTLGFSYKLDEYFLVFGTPFFSNISVALAQFICVLSSAIGGTTEPQVDRIELEPGDVVLLCSDGLTKHLSDPAIRDRLQSMTSARQVCEDLIATALADGGSDNVTAVVVRQRPGQAASG